MAMNTRTVGILSLIAGSTVGAIALPAAKTALESRAPALNPHEGLITIITAGIDSEPATLLKLYDANLDCQVDAAQKGIADQYGADPSAFRRQPNDTVTTFVSATSARGQEWWQNRNSTLLWLQPLGRNNDYIGDTIDGLLTPAQQAFYDTLFKQASNICTKYRK